MIKKEFKANYKILIIFAAVLTMYSSMIISMFDPKLDSGLEAMMESMPGVFSAFGMSNPTSELISFLANYLYGFLFVVFPFVFIALLSNRLVIKYIDSGSMAYLLSASKKRVKIIASQMFVMLAGVFLLVAYVTGLCIVLSGIVFPGKLEVSKFLCLNAGLLGLLFFFAGVSFLSACCFSDSKKANGVGAGAIIAFVLLQMVSQAGDKFEAVKYFTPMTLFNPQKIIGLETSGIAGIAALYAAAVVLFAAGCTVFSKKDLNI